MTSGPHGDERTGGGSGSGSDADVERRAPPAHPTILQPAGPGPAARVRGDAAALAALLQSIDGRGYKAYREIEGAWACNGLLLLVDHVQSDPYASASRVRVQV